MSAATANFIIALLFGLQIGAIGGWIFGVRYGYRDAERVIERGEQP